MKKITCLFIAFLCFHLSFAQFVQVGNGNSIGGTTNLPAHIGYNYSYTQNIFYPSEINKSGLIDGISWSVGNGTNPLTALQQTVIYIGTTTKTTFDSNTDWIPISQLTKVYEGPITGSPNNWTPKFTFDTPFFYNGVDNLVVVMDDNHNQWQSSHNGFYGTSVTGNRGIVFRGDATNPDPASPPNGTLKAYIANTRFYFQEVSCNTAEALNVGLAFSDNSITRQTLANTSGTGTNPTPTCGNYSGGHYWYSVVVPSNGEITIETNGTSGDTAMAIYTGSCGSLTEIACDDDSGNNNFSKVDINAINLAGQTLYIRVWEPGNDATVTYDIAAWSATLPTNPGVSLNFDGTNDYVELPNESNFNFTSSITVEAWVRVTTFNKDWQAIVTKGDRSWRIARYSNTNQVNFALTPVGNVTSTVSINDGNWHHVAGTYDGATMKIYVDGVLENQLSVTATIANSSYNVAIGENLQATGRSFHGSIDEVRIWGVSRTESEISNSYSCELAGNEAGLVAYYKFNQGISGLNNSTETTLIDVTSNGNNGTLTNFTLNGSTSNWIFGSPIATNSVCGTLSSENDIMESKIKFYPNPLDKYLVVETNSLTNANINIFEINGRHISTKKINSSIETLDTSKLQSGIYLINIKSDQGRITKKLVKN